MPSLNLELNYFDHVKAMRMESLLGNGADVLPIRLWAYAGIHSPETGRLKMLEGELERVCRWWGEKGAMIRAMIEIKILERDGEYFQIHDWFDHSGHLAAFKKRSIKANRIRWKNHRKLRTPTRTPKHDVMDSSCSAVHSSTIHTDTTTPLALIDPDRSMPIAIPAVLLDLRLYREDKKLCARLPLLWDEWVRAYPNVHLQQEIIKAHTWELTNQIKKNRVSFLTRWFARAQDHPKGVSHASSPRTQGAHQGVESDPAKYDNLIER